MKSSIPPIETTPHSFSREESRVIISVYIDTPFNESSPKKPIGYGGIWGTDFVRTAKHLVQDNVSRLAITNSVGVVCPIKNIWLHPYEDIALIRTALLCNSETKQKNIFSQPLPDKLLYIDNTLKTASLLKSTTKNMVLETTLAPGMSGSPLFLQDHTLVGIVSAQQAMGTEFVAINKTLIASRPEIQNMLAYQ